jgi:fatty-acyl-CoA synthase
MPSTSHDVAGRLGQTPTPFTMLQEVAQRRFDHPALVYRRTVNDREPTVMSYGELVAQTARAIGALRKLRIGEDDGIGILLPAIPEAVIALLAASSVGVAFPLNLLLASEAMRAQLELARVRAAFVLGPHTVLDVSRRLAQITPRLPALETIVEVPAGTREADNAWSEFLRGGDSDASFVGNPDRVAALFHTGGTTGDPKLAQLSARNIAAGALMMAAATRWKESDRVCSGLPMFHVGGAISCGLSVLSSGATLILPSLLGARDPEVVTGVWKLLDDVDASVLVMVPTSLAAIVDTPVGSATMSALRAVCTGASPLPRELGMRIEAKLRRPVCQIYGMTELSGCCTAQPCDGQFREPGVGFVPPLLEIQLRGPDGRSAERGEVYMRGPNSFKGYRSSLGVSGQPNEDWVGSGDLGALLPDGQLRLLGRSKDIIIRGGHNIDPLMIEEVAQRHPAVRVSAAAPMPDQYAGELPVLYVALKAGQCASEEEIEAFVGERIADPPARPKRVFIVADLPLTPFGKIARYKLRQAAALYCAQREVEGLQIEELRCDDTTAKIIRVRWRHRPSDETLRDLMQRVGVLGLTIETELD